MTISAYSTTAASNTAVNGVSVAEGMAPSDVNNAIREIMADIASFYGASGTKFTANATFGDGSADRNITILAANANVSSVFFGDNASSTVGRIQYSHSSDAMSLWTGSGQRLTIDSSGRSMFGRTTNFSGGLVEVEAVGDVGTPAIATNTTTSGGTEYHAIFHESGTVRGSITSNGSATAYNTSSDARLKENIADAADAGALVDAIKVRSFDWRDSGRHQDYGFVAQELAPVVPDAVLVGDAGAEVSEAWAVDYSKLVPLLVKEVQSLRARVAELEAR